MTFKELLEKYEQINPTVISEIYTAGMERAEEIRKEILCEK